MHRVVRVLEEIRARLLAEAISGDRSFF